MAYTTIDNPAQFFTNFLWTGDGSSPKSFTGVGFQADMLWSKIRTDNHQHNIMDTVRGVDARLISTNNKNAEDTSNLTHGHYDSLDNDGFTITGAGGYWNVNTNAEDYVGWFCKGGGSASSNSNGGMTISVSANTTAGFSVVTWSGNGSASTVGHGLSSAPKWIFFKARNNSSYAWFVGHEKLDSSNPWNKYMTLENSNALNDDVIWNDTAPTSSVFSVGNYASTNGSGVNFVAFCWHDVKGYSKFDSYEGNGNADGPFIYTGFRPAWIMIKNLDGTDNWNMYDSKRIGYNPNYSFLIANEPNPENTTTGTANLDILSNGFKIRSSTGHLNTSADTYIYMAFAESPFVNSNGVPTNAR